jgi:hypothetical protein
MGFFKSIKKKLSIFKKQLRKILPNEIMDNPELVAAFIIGGSIPFGESQQSLFARGATGIGNMVSNPKGYFTDLNDKFGFGTKVVGTGQKVWNPSGMMAETKKYESGFMKKGLEGVKGFLEEHPKVKKGAGKFLEKYLKSEEQPSSGDRIGTIETGATRGTYRRATGTPHTGFKAASTQIRPGYRNRYVQSSVYNILSNPNYKAIWSGSINSGDMTSIYQSAGPTIKLESSKL